MRPDQPDLAYLEPSTGAEPLSATTKPSSPWASTKGRHAASATWLNEVSTEGSGRKMLSFLGRLGSAGRPGNVKVNGDTPAICGVQQIQAG